MNRIVGDEVESPYDLLWFAKNKHDRPIPASFRLLPEFYQLPFLALVRRHTCTFSRPPFGQQEARNQKERTLSPPGTTRVGYLITGLLCSLVRLRLVAGFKQRRVSFPFSQPPRTKANGTRVSTSPWRGRRASTIPVFCTFAACNAAGRVPA
jgi:hypothetical protein